MTFITRYTPNPGEEALLKVMIGHMNEMGHIRGRTTTNRDTHKERERERKNEWLTEWGLLLC